MIEKYCSDVPDAPSCCSSCHEDEEDYGSDMIQIEVDGVNYYVCCCVSTFLEQQELSNERS